MCDGVRQGTINPRAEIESSGAVTSDGLDRVPFNASSDILTQIKNSATLQPAPSLRDTGLASIVLLDA